MKRHKSKFIAYVVSDGCCSKVKNYNNDDDNDDSSFCSCTKHHYISVTFPFADKCNNYYLKKNVNSMLSKKRWLSFYPQSGSNNLWF